VLFFPQHQRGRNQLNKSKLFYVEHFFYATPQAQAPPAARTNPKADATAREGGTKGNGLLPPPGKAAVPRIAQSNG
jgi:hypothetical protein